MIKQVYYLIGSDHWFEERKRINKAHTGTYLNDQISTYPMTAANSRHQMGLWKGPVVLTSLKMGSQRTHPVGGWTQFTTGQGWAGQSPQLTSTSQMGWGPSALAGLPDSSLLATPTSWASFGHCLIGLLCKQRCEGKGATSFCSSLCGA
jgi:hypothetical protein